MFDEYDESRKPTSAELLKKYHEVYEFDLVTVPGASDITGVPVAEIRSKIKFFQEPENNNSQCP
ncbi:MAG TPA: hypothetical protein VFI02_16560 [Armatimonadota bacterium]|nr:hypothetical protein [Armatimonadota bacterium]